jgi:hypothetical protein
MSPDRPYDRPLCHTQQQRMVFIPADIKRFKYRFRLAELPFPAVNQDHIRDLALFNGFTIATTQHLIHGRIVIARRDPVML